MRQHKFILNAEGEPEPCSDVVRWAEWFERDERRMVRKQAWQNQHGQEVTVSTVFLGINHNVTGRGTPILWETMAWVDGEQMTRMRAHRRGNAIRAHNYWVKRLGGVPLCQIST